MKLLVVCVIATLPVAAQWLRYPDAGAPRNPDGSVNLAAPAPKLADGKPDLSGIWVTEPDRSMQPGAPGDHTGASRYWLNILSDFNATNTPLRPEAQQELNRRRAKSAVENPRANCIPAGSPSGELGPDMYRIVQTPSALIMLYEQIRNFREVYLDGRKPLVDPEPATLGYSTGHWDGDTLVIEANGFNDKSWLDGGGHFHSASLKLTERYHRRDFGHMDLEIQIDDPLTFTRPFSIKVTQLLRPDTVLLEDLCAEGERDIAHMK